MEDFPTRDKAALNAEIVRALDELVAESKFHAARIKKGFAEADERIRLHRLEEEEKARRRATDCAIARETPPSYGEVPQRLAAVEGRLSDVDGRLDRIERTLADIREQMATKIELESLSDRIKMVADGYQNLDRRLGMVANLLGRPW
jgi:chromosome segregation ATPase